MIVITYWKDGNEDTTKKLICDSDEECKELCAVLKKYNMNMTISVDTSYNMMTAEVLETMLRDEYEE